MLALVVNALFFVGLEAAARAYGAVRQRSAGMLTYGRSFFMDVVTGRVQLQPRFPFRDVAKQTAAAETTYANRAGQQLPERTPSDIVADSVVAHFNRFGLRTPEFTSGRAAGIRRLATFGGSFVLGWGVHDGDEWTRLLERRLNTQERRYEVINAAALGENIHTLLPQLIRIANSVEIDDALVASSYNNHALLRLERQYSWPIKADFYATNLSYLYVLGRRAFNLLGREPLEYNLYHRQVTVDPKDVDDLLGSYRRRLEQIATVCEEHHIRLGFASEPEVFFDATVNSWDPMDEGRVRTLDAKIRAREPLWWMELDYFLQATLNLEQKRFAEARGLFFFDAATIFPRDRRTVLLDQVHLNESGNRIMAERLADALRSRWNY